MAWDNSDTFSVLSSAGRTGTWSVLSGLSLSEMSNIAILALPIYAPDLENRERYDFGCITAEPNFPLVSDEPLRFFGGPKRLSAETAALQEGTTSADSQGVIGVPIHDSIRYAKAAIYFTAEDGKRWIFGYILVLVIKCCLYLKDHGKAQLQGELLLLTLGFIGPDTRHICNQRAPGSSCRPSADIR